MLGLLACGAWAQPVVENGPWRIDVGPQGADSVTYAGQALILRSRLVGYLPQWKGGRFDLGGAAVATTANGATWVRQAPGNQDAKLTVEARENRLTFTLETTLIAAGPTEWSVALVPEALQASDQHCFVNHNGKTTTLDLANGFAHLHGVRELVFEQAERSVRLTCESATLQDRRSAGSGLFWVIGLNHDGGGAKTATHTLTVEVLPVAAAEVAGRKAMLAQVPLAVSEVAVANGGFEAEEGLEGWSENPRAVAVSDVRHGGRQAARIRIPAEQTDRTGIYLTQQIPVQAGLTYAAAGWIRTEDVKAASLGGMSPTGATVILEWADKEGKWTASGAYADGVYGDSDWRHVATKGVRAPLNAGYAIIFLSLRATGTAWFDDITLTQTKHQVVLREPAFAAQVEDNTPRFAWQYAQHGEALLELSQDPGFPTGQQTVRTAGLKASAGTVETPLAPGRWYWRVSLFDGAVVSAVWQFEQTAARDRDCTEPVIEPDHAYLSEPRQPVTVRFRDNVGVTGARLVLDGIDVSAQTTVERESATFTPAADWQPGLHRLEIEVRDAAGNFARRCLYLNCLRGVAAKRWLVQGGVGLDGQPRFLLGMYGVRLEDLREMAAAGIDFVHNYTWDGAGTNETALQYLDACREHGLQAFIGFDRARLQAEDEDFVGERVGQLSHRPALLAWYLFDEPDLPHQYVPPDQLRRLYRLIQRLDPLHPVIVTVAQRNLMPEYDGSYDVYWSMDYSTPAKNLANLEYHRSQLRPEVPLMSIVHCYDNAQRQGHGMEFDSSRFQPTPAQMHACAFMQIVHGSSGLCWWWWGQGSGLFMTVAHAPAAWAGLRETVRQIRALGPVLEAQIPVRTWIEKVGEDREIHCWEKALPERTVIIAVNRDDQPCAATLRAPGLRGTVPVLFEDRSVSAANGQVTDTFAGWAVHVYEVK
jgi:hypothetical protein